jgi:galactokinase
MQVPIATSLKEVYPEDALASQEERWKIVLGKFMDEYGRPAEFVSRSPGRVNLIGEHIDYSLYQVLPMAITADVLVAVAVHPTPPGSPSKIRLSNCDASKFRSREFEILPEGDVYIDAATHEWSNYFKAGLNGVCQLLRKRKSKLEKFTPASMDILVHGTVPTGSGLSSSTSFVCASALAVMAANGEDADGIDKNELCRVTIVSERAVGVNSGGMDQVASVFSLRGSATYVSFVPELSAEPVGFPSLEPGLTFMVAQTFVSSFKQVTAPVCYNLRVVECSLASALLAKLSGLKKVLPVDDSPLKVSLRGFHNTYFEEKYSIEDNFKTSTKEFQAQLELLIAFVKDNLQQEEGYTREEIADLLDISVDEINKRYMSQFVVQADRFKLRQRSLHVFSEALRVLKFKALLSSTPASVSGDALLRKLGDLMNEAQDSCRELYDCSCAELDELCELARGVGAYGSRLTGAGWGGCSVHLLPKDKIHEVKHAWEKNYYKKKWPDISEEKLGEAVVVSEPSSGSFLYKVTDGKAV